MSVLVLLSGGLDSAVLAFAAARDGTLAGGLTIVWGQPMWDREVYAASGIATDLGCRWWRVDAPLSDRRAMRIGSGVEGPRVVPGRNLALISLGVNIAAAHGLDEVQIGCNADDVRDYPDCRPEFIAALSACSEAAYGVRVAAPLLAASKRHVADKARALGVPIDRTWSCYEAQRSLPCVPCGTCNACRLRIAALG